MFQSVLGIIGKHVRKEKPLSQHVVYCRGNYSYNRVRGHHVFPTLEEAIDEIQLSKDAAGAFIVQEWG